MIKQFSHTAKKVLSILLSCLLALICGLYLYSANSPLGPCYSSDNSIYIIMGTALSRGYRPYLDIFDHKGPLLFLLQQLPQSFDNGFQTITIFFQEVFFLFLCLRMICRISREVFNFPEIFPQILYLCYISSLVGEGNLTEEYSNLFILISIYFYFRFLYFPNSHSPKEHLLTSIIVGLCFSVCFLIRANNALPVGCFVIGIFICYICQKKIKEIIYCISGFFIGSLVILIPISLWLIHYSALSASIQASIFHNLLYSETTSEYAEGRIHQLFFTSYGHTALFLFLICILASLLLLKRKSISLALGISLSAFGSVIAAFISHKYYDHYLILGTPLAVICTIFLLTLIPSNKRLIISLGVLIPCSIWLIFQCHLANTRRKDSILNQNQFFKDAQSLSSMIPTDELNSVYPYRVEPKWYVAARILPCNRYYFLQETLADANPAIMDEIVTFFESTPPLWLVIYNENRAFSPPYDPRVQKIFHSFYQQIDTAGEYQLLHLKRI